MNNAKWWLITYGSFSVSAAIVIYGFAKLGGYSF